VESHFGGIPEGPEPGRLRTIEPEQSGERRLTIRREGTTAYLKIACHAPSAADPLFLPALLLDAVLTGAKGINLWSSFRVPPPQRRARVYRALVEPGLASSVSGALLPTAEPFLYTVSATATDGVALSSIEEALAGELERVRRDAVTPAELETAKSQLQAQLVFDSDSITNIAHQIGYFETIASVDVFTGLAPRINAVSLDQVADAARMLFAASNRTVGWFEPLPVTGS
jgi:zinc protease